jgi:molybdopterin synthase catalytic subunit
MQLCIRVQKEDFDVAAELSALRQAGTDIGAICSFLGCVRDINADQAVTGLYLEHYPNMTEQTLSAIAEQAAQRWALNAVTIIHRVGQLGINEQIVWVAVASLHRREAFASCEFIMDFLKTQAPFWKKELRNEGEQWLAANPGDAEAAQRWLKSSS